MTREILLICTDNEIFVMYDTTLTDEEIKKMFKVTVNDIIQEQQKNLQYYCIDGRLWMNPEKDEKVRNAIKKI